MCHPVGDLFEYHFELIMGPIYEADATTIASETQHRKTPASMMSNPLRSTGTWGDSGDGSTD